MFYQNNMDLNTIYICSASAEVSICSFQLKKMPHV